MPEIDHRRISRYCLVVRENLRDMELLLGAYDDELLEDRILMKALKYSIIETAGAMADTRQHLPARPAGHARPEHEGQPMGKPGQTAPDFRLPAAECPESEHISS